MEGAYCWRGVLLSKGGILRKRFGGLDSGALFFTGGGLVLSRILRYTSDRACTASSAIV